MKKSIVLIIVLVLMVSMDVMAQCPMCRMAAESNLDHGGSAGKGLNSGIIYMLMLPYIMVALIGYIWYRNRKSDVDFLESDLQNQARTSTSQ